MPRGPGAIQRKVLLFLLGGLALGFSGSPGRYFRILKTIGREWKEINRQALYQAIRGLYRSRLIDERTNPDGSTTLVLSDAGRNRALTYTIDQMRIKKLSPWDKKWRVVIFDIPERRKKIRDAIRSHLKQMDFCELQKSVFINPYPCQDEVDFLVEFYQVRPYVRQLIVESLDNELHLKQKFRLT